MRRPRLRLFGVTLLTTGIAVGALSACDGLGPSKTYEDDATVSEKITSVRLEGDSGSITLRGRKDTAKVAMHRTIKYRDDRPDGPTHRVENGVLVLRDCGDSCSVNYTVDLPAGLPVSGEVTSGRLNLTDVGAVHVKATSGGVEMRDVTGPVDVKATSGSVVGQGLKGGPVKARVTSGGIEMRDVAGPVDVKATSGSVTGEDLKGGPVRAESSSGRIDLATTSPQDVWADASSGSVTVTVPGGPYRVSVHTGSGGKNISVPQSSSAPHHLDLTTSSGSITVKNG
ncbi:DUF4097 family beta strand repeat-containing protein [Streptomyces sp. I05A-00742]|uniref:DUF4097 family beta strand repeat-containing protein n=1 Tax=Streptomyces sp. I05A-00742 TaxID=2732853 RepID=UPI00148782C2|nr:DUF4097 family beta strand repeat-containing protein [Streptomyces sp. I05A-00742]